MFKYNFKFYTKDYIEKNIFSADALILKNIHKNKDILEVWCASWYMSKYMKEELNCKISWVEYSEEAWKKASIFQEKTYIWDLDNENFLNSIEWKFDIIIFPAVLEHLKFPEKVLKKLVNQLNDWWKIIVSLPNIAHYSIRFWLLFWNFNYTNYWILDNTHLRFFTYKSCTELIIKNSLKIDTFFCSFPFPWAWVLAKIPILNNIIYFVINNILFRFFGEELIFICSKK